MADQDTEITLGTGRLLGLFFGLVVICGLFFVAGYTLGKSAAPQPAADSTVPAPVPTASTAKPSPTRQDPVKPDCASTPEGCAPAATQAAAPPATAPEMTLPAAPAPSTPATAAPAPAPENAKAAAASYTVQVAAVSKQQDAEALAAALKKKNYAVSVVTPVSDNLFHVQIGPFNDPKEAEATRTRLLNDGYNPIVKR